MLYRHNNVVEVNQLMESPPSDNWIYNDRQFRVRVIMFNASYVSVISCQSVSLVKEAEVPGDNHQPAASH
jgi:hypothetical protein